jgi:hypothetical protein
MQSIRIAMSGDGVVDLLALKMYVCCNSALLGKRTRETYIRNRK